MLRTGPVAATTTPARSTRCPGHRESATYVKDDGPFRLMTAGTHRGVICVWEFGIVAHEHLAWTRYLRSNRDAADKRFYADHYFEGAV